MSVLDRAIIFAVNAHSGMVRKRGKSPYILHPLEAATIAGKITNDPEIIAAAVLHDTVEDTTVTIEDIKKEFGERVAALVASETENKREGIPPSESWTVRKTESLQMLKNSTDPAVKIMWLADKLSNMRSFYSLWQKQGDDMWQSFHQKDPARQAWYYRTIDSLLSDLSEYEPWREYHDLVDKVFANVK